MSPQNLGLVHCRLVLPIREGPPEYHGFNNRNNRRSIEIRINGTPRSYRDQKDFAVEHRAPHQKAKIRTAWSKASRGGWRLVAA
jgi:hypothetical protein